MKISFYEMLEVSRKATPDEIGAAYARMTAKLDATTSVRGTAETMTQVNILREGYNILCDPEKRALYDAKLYATDAGIKLMFFPKDTKAVKKLGIETVIFFLLAAVFTYVIYQKLVREPAPMPLELTKGEKALTAPPTLVAPQAGVPATAGAAPATIATTATTATTASTADVQPAGKPADK